MPEEAVTYPSEKCPGCGSEFICRPADIGNCHCNQVYISKPEYDYISSKFSGCVCNNCLNSLKQDYILQTPSTH